MSVLSTLAVRDDASLALGKGPADTRPAPSAGSVLDARLELRQGRSGWNRIKAFGSAYDGLYDALDDDAQARIQDYWSQKTGIVQSDGSFQAKSPELWQKLIWREVERARAANPKLFASIAATQKEHDAQIFTKLKGDRARNKDVAARSSGWASAVAGFAGDMAGAMSDPVNLATMAIGGPAGFGIKQLLINGLINAGGEIATMPMADKELALLDDKETIGEKATNVAAAFGLGFAFPVALKVGGKTIDIGIKGGAKMVDAAGKLLPVEQRIARALGKQDLAELSEKQIAEIFAQAVPPQYRTRDQMDALAMAERQESLIASNPGPNTYEAIDAHLAKVDAALTKLGFAFDSSRSPSPRAVAAPPPTNQGGGFDMGSYLQRNRAAESGGSDIAAAETSSAFGRYQFLKGTWISYYKKVYGNTGESNAAILRKRADGDVQDALMARFTQDNLTTLRNAGVPVNQGNAYLAHFLGPADAVKVARAAPDTPIHKLVDADSIAANPAVFGKARTAGELSAWAARKMGSKAEMIPQVSAFAGLGDEAASPYVRSPDLDAVRPDVELPQLRRDLFPDETSWRIAQAERDAEMLGMPEPAVTRQSVWEDARAVLTTAKAGEVPGALYHPDVGPIDVKWGNAKGGLQHIAERHPEVLDDLPAILDAMEVQSQSANRIVMQSDDHKAVVRLDWDNRAQQWLLTAYERKGKTPVRRSTDVPDIGAQDGSPTRGAGDAIAANAAKSNAPRGTASAMLDAYWQRSRDPKPVYGHFDDAGQLQGWSRSAKEMEGRAARDGGKVERIDPPVDPDDVPVQLVMDERYADRAGPEMKLQAERLTHDLKNAAEQDATAYRLGDGDERRIADVLEELDAEDAAIAAIRGCL